MIIVRYVEIRPNCSGRVSAIAGADKFFVKQKNPGLFNKAGVYILTGYFIFPAMVSHWLFVHLSML